jgi:hypothetical protein
MTRHRLRRKSERIRMGSKLVRPPRPVRLPMVRETRFCTTCEVRFYADSDETHCGLHRG